MYATIVLHANLQYAEIPKSEIPNVVKQSYLPVLSELLDKPSVEVVLNFTGVTLEILNNEYPEVINLIRKGLEREKFELTGCGYSHPIFPLLPREDIYKQIDYNLDILQNIFQYSPEGFWLPELAYDPTLPTILKEKGFNYIFIDEDLYRNSNPLKNYSNPYNKREKNADEYIREFVEAKNIIQKIIRFFRAKRYITERCKNIDFLPVELKGVGDTITALKAPRSWFILTYSALLNYPFLNTNLIQKLLSKFKNHEGLITLYAMDLEFFGYRSFIEGQYADHNDLSLMINRLTKTGELKLKKPKEYLKKNKPKTIGYMKTGSWAADNTLDIWTQEEDNKKLEALCEEVRCYLKLLPEGKEKEKIWKLLLLAENSDGRGWDPIPQRRLDCFSNAIEALKLAKEQYSGFQS